MPVLSVAMLVLAPVFAIAIALASTAPARAEIYDNKTLPLYLVTPEGFAIRPATFEKMDLALDIVPTGAFPARVAGESGLCGLYYKAAPSDKTQQWLNDRFKDKDVRAQARSALAASMTAASEDTFTLGDVVGLEVTGPLVDNPAVTATTSLLVTPRGRLQMICQIRTDQADKVLPVVRSIRATIKPPK